MKIEFVDITKIKRNPNNPRLIKDDKFKMLVQSIKDFPEMLELRPIIVNSDMIVLGGNMRLKACKEAGLKEVPIIRAETLTEEQQREFIIKDNVGFGEWDFYILANEWDVEELTNWGLDVPNFEDEEPSFEDLIGSKKEKPASIKITFESSEQLEKAKLEIQNILDVKYPTAFISVSAGEL